MMTKGIYLLLGSNKGDKRKQLGTARDLIGEKCAILKSSSIYKTAAWGKTDQPPFYNQVIEISTELSAELLLNFILEVEKAMGRERKEKWGERLIDIDILYYNDQMIKTNYLSVPHPEIQNRRFTLVPLVEIASEFEHPGLEISQDELLTRCPDLLEVMKIEP